MDSVGGVWHALSRLTGWMPVFFHCLAANVNEFTIMLRSGNCVELCSVENSMEFLGELGLC